MSKMMKTLTTLLLAVSAAVASGQATSGLPAPSVSTIYPNAASTGTTLNTLTKLTGAPSTVVITATTDTSGVVGVTVGNAGTSGVALVQTNGLVNLAMDGATTAGDYVQISTTTAGDGHDTGSATCPTSGQVVGRVLSTNGSAGTYQINLGANGCGSGGGSSVTWPSSTDIVISNGTNTPNGLAPVNGDCVVGSGGAWTAGACSSGTYTNVIAALSSDTTASTINGRCTTGQAYLLNIAVTMTAGGTINCPVIHGTGGEWSAASSLTLTLAGGFSEWPNQFPTIAFGSNITIVFSSSNYGSPSVQAHAPVEWWGAKGDNSTADLTPIQACLNAKPVQCDLQQGTYIISGALSITTSFVGIHGQAFDASLIKLTSATSNGITASGTSVGSWIEGNTFDNFTLYRSVLPTSSTAAGLSISFCIVCKVSWVNSKDNAQNFYLTNFANGVMSDSWGQWTFNYGSSGLTDVYGIYVDGANAPQRTQLQRDVIDNVGAIGVTFHGLYGTGADLSDVFTDWLQTSGLNYGIEWNCSSATGGFHCYDIHFKHSILDHTNTSCAVITGVPLSTGGTVNLDGGECPIETTTTSGIDIESSSGVTVTGFQFASVSGTSTSAQHIKVNASNNISIDHNTFIDQGGGTQSSALVIEGASAQVTATANTFNLTGSGTAPKAIYLTGNSVNNSLEANSICTNGVGITFDSGSAVNTAKTNNFCSTITTTVTDTPGTNQWCDASGCHNFIVSTAFPFTVIQEFQWSNGGAGTTSKTLTYPQALQSSGATAFVLWSTDGSASASCPSGWTSDFNQTASTYARLVLCQKASDGTSSQVFTSTSASNDAFYFFELSGTRAFDASSTNSTTNETTIILPAITPTAGSVVFGAAAFLCGATNPVTTSASFLLSPTYVEAPTSPNWKTFGPLAAGTSSRSLAGIVSQVAATHTSTTPPIINMPTITQYASGGVAYASFSIK